MYNAYLKNKKGFTLTEVIFVSAIMTVMIGVVLAAWVFVGNSWTREREKTFLRIELLMVTEEIQRNLRLSSATYMSYYPEGGLTDGEGNKYYTGISMPLADADSNSLFTLDSKGFIDWDETVIYYLYDDGGGNVSVRKEVISPRDNSLDHDERYDQLEGVVTNGDGEDILDNVSDFKITQVPAVIEFYENKDKNVKAGKIIMGWAPRIEAGDHEIKFEVVGKNPDSSGYQFGIDRIMIEPSGRKREMEYYASSYAPSGAIDSNGRNISVKSGKKWSNNNWLKYSANAVGDWLSITDYYDLCRESSFENASKNNVMSWGDEVRVKLELPEDREAGKEKISWMAYAQAGDGVQAGTDGDLPGYPIVMRTIISGTSIDIEGDMVRVKFKSSSENPLKIDRAYITRRDSDEDPLNEDGLPNLGFSDPPDECHFHQQLFFVDEYDMDSDGSTADFVEYAYIEKDSEVWSAWVAFPFIIEDLSGDEVDYFVTFCIPDLESVTWPGGFSTFDDADDNCKYWNGGAANTYYIDSGDYATEILPASGTPVWDGSYTVSDSYDIFVVAEIDTWKREGTVESQVYDTEISDPVYNNATWSEDAPVGTEITLKLRSSDSQFMDGAADWDSISASANNPQSLSIGDGRYFQFFAELTTELYWSASGATMTYEDYIDEQEGYANDHDFPESGGEPYITGAYSTWIDDVAVDWPGDDGITVISGYIRRRDNSGRVKVTVDGKDIIKTLGVEIAVSKDFQEQTFDETTTVEVYPKNTGR
jgi:prepilin-type N-terminal cleavage/methylation domain-containing protein